MVPIHDTDIAHERWSKELWKNYELWEKVERRIKLKRLAWILLAIALFVPLSSIPTVLEQKPKWKSLAVVRSLAFEVNQMKLEAAKRHETYRLSFEPSGTLKFKVERVEQCSDASGTRVREGQLLPDDQLADYRLLLAKDSLEFDIPGLIESFCYHVLEGFQAPDPNVSFLGMGVVPVKDLTEKRLDRISILKLQGSSSEISFN